MAGTPTPTPSGQLWAPPTNVAPGPMPSPQPGPAPPPIQDLPAWLAQQKALAKQKPKKATGPAKPKPTVTTQQLNLLTSLMRAADTPESQITQTIQSVQQSPNTFNQALQSAESAYAQLWVPTRNTAALAGGNVIIPGVNGQPNTLSPFSHVVADPFSWQSSQGGTPDQQAQLVALQQQLAKIPASLGGLQGKQWVSGQYDTTTATAYATLVDDAIHAGVDVQTYINEAIQAGVSATKASTAHFSPGIFNPLPEANVQQGIISAFTKALGRGPTPSEMATFTSQYRTAETGAFNQEETSRQQQFAVAHPSDPNVAPGESAVVTPTGSDITGAPLPVDPSTGARFPSVPDMTYTSIYHSPEAQQYQQTSLGMDLRNLIGGNRLP